MNVDDAVVRKYLSRYASSVEATSAHTSNTNQRDPCDAAIVVPAHDEAIEDLDRLIESVREDARHCRKRALLVIVVNARDDAPPSAHDRNLRLLAHLQGLAREQNLGRDSAVVVEPVDCASPGKRLPAKQGVGLARKIGCDLVLRLMTEGRVRPSFLGSTDADALVSQGYLNALTTSDHARSHASALTFPYEHLPSSDERVDRATKALEVSFRYYVLGLEAAGSPYAYHSMGSALAIHPVSYAAARGFPLRLAGEDFHLLRKLTKLGTVHRLKSPVVRIQSRRSDRAPFGTGPGVEKALHVEGNDDGLLLRDPRIFSALGHFLGVVNDWCHTDRFATPAQSDLPDTLPEPARITLARTLELWRAELEPRMPSCPTAVHRLRRAHESFDALSTLRFTHQLRDGGLPSLPLFDALHAAPFLRSPRLQRRGNPIDARDAAALRPESSPPAISDLDDWLAHLKRLEARLPEVVSWPAGPRASDSRQ